MLITSLGKISAYHDSHRSNNNKDILFKKPMDKKLIDQTLMGEIKLVFFGEIRVRISKTFSLVISRILGVHGFQFDEKNKSNDFLLQYFPPSWRMLAETIDGRNQVCNF